VNNAQSYDFLIYSDSLNYIFAKSLCGALENSGMTCCQQTSDDPMERSRGYADASRAVVLVLGKTSAFNQKIERILNLCQYGTKELAVVKMPGFVSMPRVEGYLARAHVFESVADAERLADAIIHSVQSKADTEMNPKNHAGIGEFAKIISGPTVSHGKPNGQTKAHLNLRDAEGIYNQAIRQFSTDKAAAMNRLLECARAGFVPAMLVIASEYEKKKGNPQASAKARQFYATAAKQDSSEGAFQYGMFCARQDDLHEAEQQLLKAVQSGKHMTAARVLAQWYGENGPLENPDRAKFFQDFLIECGDTKAMVARARLLLSEDAANETKALQLLEKASRTDPDASMEIADYYISRRNEAKASAYLFDAADRGNARAQYLMGIWFADGKGTCSQNLSEAARWLGRAAGAIPEAMEMLCQPRFKGFRKSE